MFSSIGKVFGLVALIVLAAACDPRVDEELISYFGAPDAEFAEAKRSAGICGATAFNSDIRPALFLNAGYVKPTDEYLQKMAMERDALILTKPGTGVVVQLGGDASLGGKSDRGCIVGLSGMSPQQSYELALPWAEQFSAPTNAELGQGLARNAIEVWNLYGDGFIVRIAAYKTWEILGEPGAAARIVTSGQR